MDGLYEIDMIITVQTGLGSPSFYVACVPVPNDVSFSVRPSAWRIKKLHDHLLTPLLILFSLLPFKKKKGTVHLYYSLTTLNSPELIHLHLNRTINHHANLRQDLDR
jgi:hypothetical protein